MVPSDTIQGDTMSQSYIKAFDTENPEVPAAELACVKADFTRYVHVGTPTNHSTIQPRTRPLTVGVSRLQGLVASMQCVVGGPVRHGVLLHYGLDNNMGFDVMLQVVCLSYWPTETKNYSYVEPADGYTLDGNGGLVHDAAALTNWYGQNGPGTRYARNVVIDRNADGTWTAFDAAQDVRSTIFPYELQITGLINDNNMGANDLLRIEPIAEPWRRMMDGTGGHIDDLFHQGAAWVPVGVTIDDQQHPRTYTNKAADLGSPCPYACPNTKFNFYMRGFPRRKGC